MHIVSLVEGEKREDKDCFDVLSTFLPAGTLSGAPKIRAMEIIEELEEEKKRSLRWLNRLLQFQW